MYPYPSNVGLLTWGLQFHKELFIVHHFGFDESTVLQDLHSKMEHRTLEPFKRLSAALTVLD